MRIYRSILALCVSATLAALVASQAAASTPTPVPGWQSTWNNSGTWTVSDSSAFDTPGNIFTEDATDTCYSGAYITGANAYIVVDMGAEYTFSAIYVHQHTNGITYGSVDGVNWELIGNAYSLGIDCGSGGWSKAWSGGPWTYRYIKWVYTNANLVTNYFGGFSINASAPNPTATPTASITPTPATTTPTPVPTQSAVSWLRDGSFEYPELLGSGWQYEGSGAGRTEASFFSWLNYGVWDADCGQRFQILDDSETSSIYQTFGWNGGNMVLTWSGRSTTSLADYYLDGYTLDISMMRGNTEVFSQTYTYPAGMPGWNRLYADMGEQAADDYTLRFTVHTVYWGDTQPDMDGIALDNIWLDHVVGTACVVEDTPTPTPRPSQITNTPARSPTVTGTPPTRTATPTGPTPTQNSTQPGPSAYTATPAPAQILNCDFEMGRMYWTFSDNADVSSPGGITGDTFAALTAVGASVSQPFMAVKTPLYVTFWARGIGRVSIVANGLASTIWQSSYASWTLVHASVNVPNGFGYTLKAESTTREGFAIDGVAVAANGFAYCGNYATPTPGGTPSPWPSRTMTPYNTGTPRATGTPRPTGTLAGPEQTSVAQGTPVGTVTPGSGSGGGSGAGGSCTDDPINCPVGDQPAAGSDVVCVRPEYFWEVAAWIDYSRCQVLWYFTWHESNTAELLAIGSGGTISAQGDAIINLDDYEPFGAVAEIVGAIEVVRSSADQYRWVDTGYTGVWDVERPDLIAIGKRWLDNGYSLDGPDATAGISAASPNVDPVRERKKKLALEIDMCSWRIMSVFSNNVASGVCSVWAYLHYWGIVAWLQFFFDLAINLTFVRYLWRYMSS